MPLAGLAHSTFGVSVHPIQPKGADFAKRIRTACPPNQGITDLLNIFKIILSLTYSNLDFYAPSISIFY